MTPLHQFGQALRDLLNLIPLGAVRVIFVVLLAALLLWVVTLPRDVDAEVQRKGWSGDLRLWAAIALLIQIFIYVLV